MIQKTLKTLNSNKGAAILPLVILVAALAGLFAGTVAVQRQTRTTSKAAEALTGGSLTVRAFVENQNCASAGKQSEDTWITSDNAVGNASVKFVNFQGDTQKKDLTTSGAVNFSNIDYDPETDNSTATVIYNPPSKVRLGGVEVAISPCPGSPLTQTITADDFQSNKNLYIELHFQKEISPTETPATPTGETAPVISCDIRAPSTGEVNKDVSFSVKGRVKVGADGKMAIIKNYVLMYEGDVAKGDYEPKFFSPPVPSFEDTYTYQYKTEGKHNPALEITYEDPTAVGPSSVKRCVKTIDINPATAACPAEPDVNEGEQLKDEGCSDKSSPSSAEIKVINRDKWTTNPEVNVSWSAVSADNLAAYRFSILYEAGDRDGIWTGWPDIQQVDKGTTSENVQLDKNEVDPSEVTKLILRVRAIYKHEDPDKTRLNDKCFCRSDYIETSTTDIPKEVIYDCSKCVGGTVIREDLWKDNPGGWDTGEPDNDGIGAIAGNNQVDNCREACLAHWGPQCTGVTQCSRDPTLPNPRTDPEQCCECQTATGASCDTLPEPTSPPATSPTNPPAGEEGGVCNWCTGPDQCASDAPGYTYYPNRAECQQPDGTRLGLCCAPGMIIPTSPPAPTSPPTSPIPTISGGATPQPQTQCAQQNGTCYARGAEDLCTNSRWNWEEGKGCSGLTPYCCSPPSTPTPSAPQCETAIEEGGLGGECKPSYFICSELDLIDRGLNVYGCSDPNPRCCAQPNTTPTLKPRSGSLTGYITDFITNERLADVSIVVRDSLRGKVLTTTKTDNNGVFSTGIITCRDMTTEMTKTGYQFQKRGPQVCPEGDVGGPDNHYAALIPLSTPAVVESAGAEWVEACDGVATALDVSAFLNLTRTLPNRGYRQVVNNICQGGPVVITVSTYDLINETIAKTLVR